jgi:hypothetical protein
MYKKSVIAFEMCLQGIEFLDSGTLKVNKMCYLPHTIVYGKCFYFNGMFHKLKYLHVLALCRKDSSLNFLREEKVGVNNFHCFLPKM